MSYEVKTDSAGKFRFNLKAGNGQVILSSESYATKAGALDGIASCQTNGPLEERFERKDSVSGQPYFVLKAKNGEILGRSEMYSGTAARETGIESVKKNSPSTDIKIL
jgi:uncharacterized protein YegP (UPF0339 family)